MGIEILKTSAYQNEISSSSRISNTGGRMGNNVGISMNSYANHPIPKAQDVIENDGDSNEAVASEQHIKAEISKANTRLKNHNTRCEFSYHESTGRVSIKVMDWDTEEVIREIPPEKTLEMLEKMWELAGLLIDEKR